MANVTISKANGYFTIELGDYYPSAIQEPWHDFPPNDYGGICGKKIGDEEGIELHIHHEEVPFYLSHQAGLTNFMQVDSVGGEIPTSLQHLRELIINLFNVR